MRNKCVRLVDVNKVRSLHLAALELRIAFVNLQYLPDQLVLVVGAVRAPCGLKQQMLYYLYILSINFCSSSSLTSIIKSGH